MCKWSFRISFTVYEWRGSIIQAETLESFAGDSSSLGGIRKPGWWTCPSDSLHGWTSSWIEMFWSSLPRRCYRKCWPSSSYLDSIPCRDILCSKQQREFAALLSFSLWKEEARQLDSPGTASWFFVNQLKFNDMSHFTFCSALAGREVFLSC